MKEIHGGYGAWSPASEIWALGAVIYTMMTGIPPPRQFDYHWQISRMSDKGYTSGLKEIVGDMLKTKSGERPTTAQVVGRVNEGWEKWRDTDDARGFVDWKDRSRGREVKLDGQVEETGRKGWGIIE